EMRAVLVLNAIQLVQLEPGFVDQRRGGERVAVTLATQPARGQLVQLVIHEQEHLFHFKGFRRATIIRRDTLKSTARMAQRHLALRARRSVPGEDPDERGSV